MAWSGEGMGRDGTSLIWCSRRRILLSASRVSALTSSSSPESWLFRRLSVSRLSPPPAFSCVAVNSLCADAPMVALADSWLLLARGGAWSDAAWTMPRAGMTLEKGGEGEGGRGRERERKGRMR